MEVIRATAMGMCFGVRDALEFAAAVPHPEQTTIYGELVHNEEVQRDLAGRGFRQLGERERDGGVPTPRVLITAHGIAEATRRELLARGHTLLDTTCPLVVKAHAAALALAAAGRHVVVLGRRDHVEVRGLVGDLPEHTVVQDLADVARWPHPRLGIVCQTTLPETEAALLRAAIAAANPDADIAFRDTVCEPTKARLRAVQDLAGVVEAVVVVGGRHSNNTRQLVGAVAAAGKPAFHVQGPADLDWRALAAFQRIGLTAGTSTQDRTIDAVEAALRAGAVGKG